MKRFLLILSAALPLQAATTIEVSAKFADVPAGTVVTASSLKSEKVKGVNVLSAPKVTTTPGEKATIEVTQSQSAPGGASVPLGLTLEVTPSVGEKSITFSGKATDRAMHGKRSGDNLSVVEFATREVYFNGSSSSGETVLIHTAPAVTKSAAKGAEATSRELVLLLTFVKKTTEPEPAKKSTTGKSSTSKPAAKSTGTKSTGTKSGTTKITPVKKKK